MCSLPPVVLHVTAQCGCPPLSRGSLAEIKTDAQSKNAKKQQVRCARRQFESSVEVTENHYIETGLPNENTMTITEENTDHK